MRHDGRQTDELRPITVQRHFTGSAPGSVLIKAGRTTVLCTASIDDSVPPWKKYDENPTGWVTAEYSMLPGSTSPRKRRKADGRSTEIQRLIGRSLRAIVDFEALGERTITIDCDVLEADGALLDLDYVEDSTAAVDMNVVMTGSGEYVEVQGTAEQKPFSRQLLDEQLSLAELGIARLTQIQRDALGAEWPLDSNG